MFCHVDSTAAMAQGLIFLSEKVRIGKYMWLMESHTLVSLCCQQGTGSNVKQDRVCFLWWHPKSLATHYRYTRLKITTYCTGTAHCTSSGFISSKDKNSIQFISSNKNMQWWQSQQIDLCMNFIQINMEKILSVYNTPQSLPSSKWLWSMFWYTELGKVISVQQPTVPVWPRSAGNRGDHSSRFYFRCARLSIIGHLPGYYFLCYLQSKAVECMQKKKKKEKRIHLFHCVAKPCCSQNLYCNFTKLFLFEQARWVINKINVFRITPT